MGGELRVLVGSKEGGGGRADSQNRRGHVDQF